MAVITKGLEVSQVTHTSEASQIASGNGESCTVSVRDGRRVLLVSLIPYASQEQVEQLAPKLCPSGRMDESDKSCTAYTADSGKFAVHGVAGRWEVRVSVYEVPVNDEAKDAVYQILDDLRNSDKTK